MPDFDQCLQLHGLYRDRYMARIELLWKCRFALWALIFGIASVAREPAKVPTIHKLVACFLAVALALFGHHFERFQEKNIAAERAEALDWLGKAKLVVGASALSSPPSVARLRLWLISYFLAFALCIILWA